MDNGGNNRESPSKRPMLTDDDRKTHRSVPSSSSVHQVMFNDDLLIEILLRLPALSLFFFKSVSKRWLSLITSPAFFNLHFSRFPNVHPPCGLFLQKKTYNDTYEISFVSLDTKIPAGKKKKSSVFNFGCFGSDASKVRLLQSCNGLVLCLIHDKICVYNPSINVFKKLPRVHGLGMKTIIIGLRLAFDPAKSPHYKVLFITITTYGELGRPDSIQTWIYSSETGRLRIGMNIPCYHYVWFGGQFERGVYLNDAIHWLDKNNRVLHFKLDVEHPDITITEPPETLVRDSYKELFESRGCLLLACEGYPHSKRLEIYEMRNGYSGWSLRYIVKYEDGIAAFFETWKMSTVGFRFQVLCIAVGEREEESFVVMNLCGKVVKYNLLLKTLHVLCDIDTHGNEFRTFPLIASFAGV